MRAVAVQIVPDLVKHGVLALALLLPVVRVVAAVAAKVDNSQKSRLSLLPSSRQWPRCGCWHWRGFSSVNGGPDHVVSSVPMFIPAESHMPACELAIVAECR